MKLVTVATAHPPHRVEQDEIIAALEDVWAETHHNVRRVRRFHEAVQVEGRWLALPLDGYRALKGFGDANDVFLDVGTRIGAEALSGALDQASLGPHDLDGLFTATVTGVATPSLDARLYHRLGLRDDLVRTPIFGLGCVAGAAGLSRVHDWLKAWPDRTAALLSVELCSLTLQREDLSVANLIASGLFGDGSAAVLCVGDERAEALGLDGPTVVATASRLYPDSERVMGWDITDGGFQVVLDKSVPAVVERYLRDDVDGFLADHGLTRDDIGSWVCHPGGPKVLTAFESSLDLPEGALDLTWRSLREVGNLSSASVLHVLRDTLEQRRPAPGTWGLILAMGPGFCSELVLVRW